MKLSVVIPAYNEEDNIECAVREVVETFFDAEIIVVNDASTDSTLRILTDLQILYKLPQLKVLTNEKNRGHGYSVIKGLYAATGDYILYIDADRQISLQNLKDNYHIVTEGIYDVVSGYRVHRNDKLFRKIISFGLKSVIFWKYWYRIKDANCPFKIYRLSTLRPLLQQLPITYIIPIACLQVLARENDLFVGNIPTPHYPYKGIRKGFLQSMNPKMFSFIWSAFKEIISL